MGWFEDPTSLPCVGEWLYKVVLLCVCVCYKIVNSIFSKRIGLIINAFFSIDDSDWDSNDEEEDKEEEEIELYSRLSYCIVQQKK